jgi:hypothetical protein
VGRTGSGKSTLLLALYRMFELDKVSHLPRQPVQLDCPWSWLPLLLCAPTPVVEATPC